jgi:hypothetical protein
MNTQILNSYYHAMVLILYLHHNTSLEFAALSILENTTLLSYEIQAKHNSALVGFEVPHSSGYEEFCHLGSNTV